MNSSDMSAANKKWLIVAAAVVGVAAVLIGLQVWSAKRTAEKPQTSVISGQSVGSTSAAVPSAKGGQATSGGVSSPPSSNRSLASTSEVAPQGRPLAVLPSAPTRTVSALKPDLATANVPYSVEFQPYGLGPERGRRPTLVVKMDRAAAPNGRRLLRLQNANVLLIVEPAAARQVEAGGTYSGTIVFKLENKRLVPYLTAVR